MAGDDQLAALDLQPDLVGVDPGELGVDDRAGRLAFVEDVDRGREAAAVARAQDAGAEDVAEQLVHLAAHPLEVGEEVALGGHADECTARVAAQTS